jgi:hypothetical protein
VLDEQAIGNQAGRQPPLVEGPPIGLAERPDVAMQDAVATKDLAAGVAEGGRLA